MSITSYKVTVTTDGSGNASEKTLPITGFLEHVGYTPHGSTPLDTGADLDITGESSGIVVANHDNIGTSPFTRAYRQATHGVDGAAATYDGTEPVLTRIALAGERLAVAIANGGAAKSGTFEFVVSDD